MQISYRTILKEAWQITSKNKILWLFGIFASFISLEAVYEVIWGQINQLKSQQIFYQQILNLYQGQTVFLNQYCNLFDQLATDYTAYFIFILIAVIIVLFIWLVFTAQIFIIKSAAALYYKKKMKINELLSESYEKFWSVLGINIITKLILYAGFLALSLPLLYSLLINNNSAITASNIFFFIIFTIFAVIISFLAAYATNFIVLKNSHILESIKEAWQLFSKNIMISLELSFILFFLKMLSLILIFCLFFLAFIPLLMLFLLTINSGSIIGMIMSLTLIILAFTLISLFINAVFTVFYLSSWTITFIKLSEETLMGRIINMVKSIPGLFNKTAKKYQISIDKKQLKKEAKIMAKKLEAKYVELKPKAKAQSKIVAKKLKEGYIKFEPIIEKEIKKIIAQKKKKSTAKPMAKKKMAKKPATKKRKTIIRKKGPTKKTARPKRKSK